MTNDEYERGKAWLEEQRRVGIELIERSYAAQLRALELVYSIQRETADASGQASVSRAFSAPAKQQPARPQRGRRAPEVAADVRKALLRLPGTFTRREVVEALGYEPDRAVLYRILQDLKEEGVLRIESRGLGQRATVYKNAGFNHSSTEG